MVPKLENDEKKKNKTLLFAGIAVIVILVIIGAVVGYLYLDDQKKQEDAQRESLRQAFTDQQNETARLYTLIGGYPVAGNKNIVEDFRKWAEGYRQLAINYSQAVALLATDGAAYQQMLEAGTDDYANVTRACSAANSSAIAVNTTAAGYENEVLARQGMKDNASTSYSLALNRSNSFYDVAWNLMQQNADYLKFGGYLKYLEACARNNTYYNDSIGLVESTGAVYQAYLKDSGYYAVNTTILGLEDNASKLGSRYADLQKWKPEIVLNPMDINLAWSSEKGFYEVVNFQIYNYNRRNNTDPQKIWNIVVHYNLIDAKTGNVRSSADVTVTMNDYWQSDVYYAILPCDENGEYRYAYTISYEY